VNRTGLRSCPKVGFGVSDVASSASTARELSSFVVICECMCVCWTKLCLDCERSTSPYLKKNKIVQQNCCCVVLISFISILESNFSFFVKFSYSEGITLFSKRKFVCISCIESHVLFQVHWK
jgi:uncharacterized membrane protein YwzB